MLSSGHVSKTHKTQCFTPFQATNALFRGIVLFKVSLFSKDPIPENNVSESSQKVVHDFYGNQKIIAERLLKMLHFR